MSVCSHVSFQYPSQNNSLTNEFLFFLSILRFFSIFLEETKKKLNETKTKKNHHNDERFVGCFFFFTESPTDDEVNFFYVLMD